MKNGVYAIYKGNEYRASSKDGKILLISYEKQDTTKGFELDIFSDNYVLLVDRCDVDKYYTRAICCTYSNDIFIIADQQEDKYLLISGTRSYLLSELGFIQTDRGEFRKWVSKNEVKNVFEEISERK